KLVEHAVAEVEAAREAEVEVRMAVLQLAAEDAAVELAAVLAERTGLHPDVGELDPVVGVHVGPGTLGVVVAPQPDP
ncbi:MAG: DegV family protein, partial [Ornithinimicrobium sp.]|uniref:DegV family protein n=1 Tax=Ornithinimicrobium sp. TaxID=1977084 RepID=UPI0026DF987E